MGIAVVAPFLFSVSAPRNVRWLRVSRLLELGGVLVCLVVLTYFVSRSPLPLAWAAFPFLIWAAARFGPAGGASASLVVSLITLWFTSRHEGLFAQWDLHTNLAVLQAFLAVVTFTSSFVGAAVAQIAESEAERARLRASEAAAREREVIREQLLGVLGHDLRNPLAAIRTGIDVMVRQERPEARQRLAERMRGSCARMTRLIEDILDFTRSRLGGGIPTNRAPADLAEICARVVGELETAHPARRFVLSSPVAIVGFWDAERLAQVVSNLVGNAVEHSEGDVRVAVTTSGSDRVTLEVANGGRPIPPELLASLFEPFARGARSGQGLGLGLYIVREIIRAHEGEVSVTSDAERGTVFTVRLPRGPEAGGAGAADAPAAAAPERRALPSV
jgi:signal transduction histidine kinase